MRCDRWNYRRDQTLGHPVIRLGVDHEGGAAFVKQRVCAITERRAFNVKCRFTLAALVHSQIGQIPDVGMWILGVVNAVMRVGRIEVTAAEVEAGPSHLPTVWMWIPC